MARTRGYEIDEVVEAAMGLFWEQGYGATSMSDVYAATGLKPGSLYAAVSSKEELFRRAFERYADHFRSTLPVGIEGRAAIEAWLRTQVRLATDDPARRGCLIVNTVLERNQHPESTRALAQGRLAEIRSFFLRHLVLARSRGEIDGALELDALADALLAAVFSIMTLARAGADPSTIRNTALATSHLLGPGKAKRDEPSPITIQSEECRHGR